MFSSKAKVDTENFMVLSVLPRLFEFGTYRKLALYSNDRWLVLTILVFSVLDLSFKIELLHGKEFLITLQLFPFSHILQRNFHVASIYAGKDSVLLKGASVISELKYLLNLLTLCWHFSKKPFPLFLEATGYSVEDVLLQEPKAGVSSTCYSYWSLKYFVC